MAETTEKITLDMLTPNDVSVMRRQYTAINGVEQWRRAYVNSPSGRQQVQDEVPEPYRSAIFAVWGETPTISEVSEA